METERAEAKTAGTLGVPRGPPSHPRLRDELQRRLGDLNGVRVTPLSLEDVKEDGREIDAYRVEIRLADDYLRSLLTAIEMGGRIPRTSDHHVNERDA